MENKIDGSTKLLYDINGQIKEINGKMEVLLELKTMKRPTRANVQANKNE